MSVEAANIDKRCCGMNYVDFKDAEGTLPSTVP
jgi:hypothetical protein